jgi:Lipocalin-like domain
VSLRDAILGAWELASFVTVDAPTGEERHPLGAAPRGLIMYTSDGHMSAQLADSDMGGYVAYGGRFTVIEDTVNEETATVHHDVTLSMMPELLTQTQFRQARVDGDLLTLSATTTDASGVEVNARLVWRRARSQGG